MNIMFYGDPHGDFTPLFESLSREVPDLVVVLGDVGPCDPLDQIAKNIKNHGCDFKWIHGNHDADSEELFDCSLQVAQDDNLHRRIERFQDIKIAGLGGVYRGKVWMPESLSGPEKIVFNSPDEMLRATRKMDQWRDGLPRRHRATIFPSYHQDLIKQGHADILVCHEAPSSHRNGFYAIDDLAKALKASLIVHGHHHYDYDGTTRNGIHVKGVGKAECFYFNT